MTGLKRLLDPRSVALVGASTRKGSLGNLLARQLLGGGFAGQVWLVNPRYDTVEGRTCYPTLADVPGEVDLVVLAVPNAALEEQLTSAVVQGAGGAVIVASGHSTSTGQQLLTERLAAIARAGGDGGLRREQHGIRQLRSPAADARLLRPPGARCGTHHLDQPLGFGAQRAVLHNDRGLQFNLVVSAGQEFTATVADYMAYALEQPTTKVIGLFLETVRDPAGFRHALAVASERDVPVVILKVGREEEARRMVTAHSGALAGEDAVFGALCEAHGAVRVETLGELVNTLELFASARRAGPGALATVHDSGGERAHLIDVAAQAGVPLARISETTTHRLQELLDPGLPPVNPLDVWGTGNDFERICLGSMSALVEDPATAALAFVVDLDLGDLTWRYAEVAQRMAATSTVPFAVLSNLSAAIHQPVADSLRRAGIPVLEGTSEGIAAFGHLFAYRDRPAAPTSTSRAVLGEEGRRWRRRLESGEPLLEVESLALLSAYGIPTAATRATASLDEALDAAAEIGYPVALKIAHAAHKSDVGGVRLNLADEEQLIRAHRGLSSRFGVELTVQKMGPSGVEMALGLLSDPDFGPMVLVATGGVWVEVLGDRRLGVPPLTRDQAEHMIGSLRGRRLLQGMRGAPPADVGALADALVALSALALDLGDLITALDVNPLLVNEHGCLAVDAFVQPHATQGTTVLLQPEEASCGA